MEQPLWTMTGSHYRSQGKLAKGTVQVTTKAALKNAKLGEREVNNGHLDGGDGYFKHVVFINSYC